LSHSTSSVFVMFFQDRVLRTICHGWLRTSILLISASWVAKDYRHETLTPGCFFFFMLVAFLSYP
jgi:hypothetical protein